MGTKRADGLPARLEGVRRRLERWRKTHPARSRIPKPLWTAVVKMAEAYGIHRTAKALRLDYYSVKRRVEEKASAETPEERGAAAFLELAPAAPSGACECTLECEDPGGAKMRVYLKGSEMPDLAAVSRSFWQVEP